MAPFMPNFSCGPCMYCNEISESKPEDLLKCEICKRTVHFVCLKSGIPQYRLLGDNFFHYTCIECNPRNAELVVRSKLSFIHLLLLSLYNLHLTRKNEANKGYFHYRTHIHSYINSKWLELYSYDGVNVYKEKSKLPPSYISGQLSHSQYFVANKEDGGRGGWYRLKTIAPPNQLIHQFQMKQQRKRGLPVDFEPHREEAKALKAHDFNSNSSSCSTLSTTSSVVVKEDMFEESSIESLDESSRGSWYMDVVKPAARLPPNIFAEEDTPLDVEEPDPSINTLLSNPVTKASEEVPPIHPEEEEQLKHTSLFTHSEETEKTSMKEEVQDGSKFVLLNYYEEKKLLKKLDSLPDLGPELYRLRRKLKVRQSKREHGLSLFNIDAEVSFLDTHKRLMTEKEKKTYNYCFGDPSKSESNLRILDRFQVPEKHLLTKKTEQTSFKAKLIGASTNNFELIHSPYSLRKMKPFIFRDGLTVPLKLKLLQEVVESANRRGSGTGNLCVQKSIDYCYVTPKHIPAMNHMARQFFWPGIDLSEVLHYPDFTCVVLYGHLVIGFGVIVPDTSNNEAYVSFLLVHPEWRRAGIAKFILYHLIQTCAGKDITLHVSATNPALIMYQQFGFKVEEFLSDFYDKYLPEDSPQCKHAMFLRLRR